MRSIRGGNVDKRVWLKKRANRDMRRTRFGVSDQCRAPYWAKQFWNVEPDMLDSDIVHLRVMRCAKERIVANPPTRQALTAALLDLAWIRLALQARGVGLETPKYPTFVGARCPLLGRKTNA